MMLKSLQKIFLANEKAVLLIAAGSFAWSLTMVKSGLRYDYGIGFWGPNGHDGVWHLSLAKALASGSNEMPIFAGEAIKNYHIGFDLLLAAIHKVTTIPISVLYFQIFPPVAAVLIGLLTYTFVLNWKKSQRAAFWSTFFVYFGGNIAWIINRGESTFWAQPSALTLINPPFALSLIFILVGSNLLLKLKPNSHFTFYILLAFVFGLLIQIKAYAGVVVLGALLLTALYEFWKRCKLSYLKIFLISGAISFVVFLPNLSSGSLMEFKPFWFLETMMSFSDRLGWTRFGEAMVNYKLGGVWIKAVLAYGVALLIFWYGNLGTRFIHEFYWLDFVRNKKKLGLLDVFFGAAITIGFVLTMFFVQRGTAWNTIQFFYYSLFFVSILSGVVFAGMLEIKNKKVKYLLILGILIFTLPTTVSVLGHYLPTRPPAKIANEELSALEFLSKQPKGTVLVMPFDRKAAEAAINNPPRPLYLYESTAYVSAFTGKPVWLEDEVNLDITDYDWKKRKSDLLDVLSENNQTLAREFLKKENISYVYLVNHRDNVFSSLEKVFGNDHVKVYKAP